MFFFFVGLPHLATYIFSYFSTNEPELGAGIDPGMALTFTISIYHFGLEKIRTHNLWIVS